MRGTSKAPAAKARSKPMTLKRLRTRIGVPVALMAMLVLALPGSASAFLGLGEQKEFFAPTQPTKPLTLTQGPDGNVWYTNDGSTKIGKVTPAGVVTEYSPGLAGNAHSITAGPDGDIWFTEIGSKKVGHIDPSAPTTSLVEIEVTNLGTEATTGSFITAGPDGNLWVTLGTKGIARVTPAGGVSEFAQANGLNASANVCSITAGSVADGNVWFGDCASTRAIGKITPAGVITETTVTGSIGNRPHSIAFGSDGRIWFPANKATEERIGAITTATPGVPAYYPTGLGAGGGANLTGLAAGADGNVWAKETAIRNEKQTLTIQATEPNLGGTYKLGFGGKETGPIAYNAEAPVIKGELEALSSIGAGNVEVTPVNTSTSLVTRVIEFRGKFARTDVPLITCDGSGLTGTSSSCSLVESTTALAERLYRFKPSGEFTAFPLAAKTVTPTPVSTGRGGTLAPGPDGSLWFTTAGDPTFVSTSAIGKFGLGIEKPELTVTKEGEGSGTVVSSPAGIECGGTCSAEFTKDSIVTLTASPAAGSLFTSWKKCDAKAEYEPGKFTGVEGRKCTVKMSLAKTVWAKFTPAFDVTVKKTTGNTGLGSISGILCDANCASATASFAVGKTVKLTPKAYKGSAFTEWSSCPGSIVETNKCEMAAAGTAEAKFTAIPRFSLTVNKTGGGQGTVKSFPATINCSLTCPSMTSLFEENVQVELTASVTLGKGSAFAGWSGGTGTCTGTTSPCKTSAMTGNQSITAKFE